MELLFRNVKFLVSRKNRLAGFLSRYNITPAMPLFLLIHITLNCNKRCSWCYQEDKGFYHSIKPHMDSKAFEGILLNFKYIKPHIHLYGGEPLSHPEFTRFLKYSGVYGYQPTVTTNGDYLDKYGQELIKSTVSQLNLSVNGILDSCGEINAVLNAKIKKFLEDNRGKKTVNLNYVLEPKSYNHVDKVIEYFNNNYKAGDFAYFVVQHLIQVPEPASPLVPIDSKKLAELLAGIKKRSLKFRLLFLPDIKIKDINSYYNYQYPLGKKCYVPWLGLNIYPDLTVTPGAGAFGCSRVLGDLNQDSIMNVWRGPKLKNFRLELTQKGLLPDCNRCCHKVYY